MARRRHRNGTRIRVMPFVRHDLPMTLRLAVLLVSFVLGVGAWLCVARALRAGGWNAIEQVARDDEEGRRQERLPDGPA